MSMVEISVFLALGILFLTFICAVTGLLLYGREK